MKRLPSLLLLVLLACFSTACDSSGGDEGDGTLQSITGTWRGDVVSGGTPLTVEMELVEALTSVSGTGFVDAPQGRQTFAIIQDLSGYIHPTLSLRLLYDGTPQLPGTMAANVTPDRSELRGTLDGPGFAGIVELTLRRVSQP